MMIPLILMSFLFLFSTPQIHSQELSSFASTTALVQITPRTTALTSNTDLENRITAIESENRLITRIEYFVNIFTTFATIFLGLIAYNIWKSDKARLSAEEDVAQIKNVLREALVLQERHKDIITSLEKLKEDPTQNRKTREELDGILNAIKHDRNDFFHKSLRHFGFPESREQTEMRHESENEAAEWRAEEDKKRQKASGKQRSE